MHKTFEDIIPPSRRRSANSTLQETRDTYQKPNNKHPTYTGRFPYTPAVIALGIIIIFGIIIFLFSGASAQIDPMTATANLSANFTASASTTTPLPFAVISVKKIATQSVSGDGTYTVHQASHGKITIYNTQSKRQRLVAKTRFESSDGLVFRIRNAIVVPASHGIVPGSVTATVYADTAGSQYNITSSSFTVPGLAGTRLASKVYAKSFVAMSGGFSGVRAKVSSSKEASTHALLRSALAKDLANAIKAQVPANYVLISGAATTTYTNLPSVPVKSGNSAYIRTQGVTTAVVFPKSAFAKLIATNIIGTYHNQPVTLTSTKNLTLIPTKGILNLQTVSGDKVFNFALSGSTTVVWTVNKNRIEVAISGKTRNSAYALLKDFPEVKQAHLTLKPFWRSTFPSDPSKITVIVNPVQTDTNTNI